MQEEREFGFWDQLKHFLVQATVRLVKGLPVYYVWLIFLLILIGGGLYGYSKQFQFGLTITGMPDQVSWGCIFPILSAWSG